MGEKVLGALLGNRDLTQYGEKSVSELNASKRLPAIILVDTSGSMHGSEALLKRSVEDLYTTIMSDRAASNMTELAVMTFNSEIEILERMREIKKHEGRGRNLEFNCEGVTLTGLALKMAISHLEARLNVYKSHKPVIKYCAPLLFILSDGKPVCNDEAVKPEERAAMQYAKNYIQREVAANRMAVIAVEVGDECDHALMRELTGLRDDKHVKKVTDSSQLASFFKLTSSIIIHSAKNANRTINDMDLNAFQS